MAGLDQLKLEERVNVLKLEGNAFITANRFALAAEKYSEAIEVLPTAVLYSNRAQAFIKMESYGLAIADADEAIGLDKSYIKAYYRRGSANYALGVNNLSKLKAARKDFKEVLKIKPADMDARKKYTECDNKIKAQAFALAIESEDGNKTDVADLNIDAIVVSSDYTGPKFVMDETGKMNKEKSVTVEFVQELIATFRDQKLLHRKYMLQLLIWCREMMENLPSLMEISLPTVAVEGEESKKGHITVCGDTHGQFYDLLNIFEIGGFPSPENPYLFNGDFVDRGSFSVETVTTLLALKLAMPTAIFMTRGNHETKNMNKIYGFEGEVKHKYDDKCMNLFNDVFQWLPLAAVIENSVFVVHGGLSTNMGGSDAGKDSALGEGMTLDAIRAIPRGREPPEAGLMSDLLWSDPQPFAGRSASKRGVGYAFGPDYTRNFLALNGLKLLVRSHEVKDEGYVEEHDGKCITIFSAPNYCDSMGNKGAFIRFSEDMVPNFTKFDAVSHPNVPPMRYAGNMFGL